ncbi:hypothetical protein V8F20_009113 [Naviculisporaceae sp. PSN 640]
MDQAPATGIGHWDPNSFVNESWDHNQFGGSTLDFDPNYGHHAPDAGYHTPEGFISNASQINPQLSAPDNQAGLYRQFDHYQQPPGEVWSGQIPSSTPYGHEASLSQGFYAAHQAPVDNARTVDSRFAPVEEYQDHHMPVQENQEALPHGFAGQVQSQPQDNYQHGNATHWGPRVSTPTPGYVPRPEFEAPVASPQVVNVQNQNARGSPSFPSNQGPVSVSGPVQAYPVNHQPIENRQPQPQPQYVQNVNGHPVQNRGPIAQVPVARSTGSPHVATQPMVQHAAVPQTLSQSQLKPMPQPNSQPQLAPQHVTNQLPPQESHPTYPQVVHQFPASAPSPDANNGTTGVKRRPTSEVQEPKPIVKKTKLAPPPVPNTGSPSASTPVPEPAQPAQPAGPFIVDGDLLEAARARPSGTWRGVPYLVIGETPVKLKKGPPTKRYVVISAKGGKDPLLPSIARGWTPAESLGNHADAYQNAKNDLDRQRADVRLEIEMERGGSEIPSDWWKKLPRGDSTTEAKRMDPPPEPLLTAIKASEYLRMHPAHKTNRQVLLDIFEDYYDLVLEKATALKNSPTLEKLAKAAKSRAKNPASVDEAEFEALKKELDPLKKQLECAIVEGLKSADPRVLTKMGEKNNVAIRLINILINLINIGDANSSLAKAVLRLFGTFTSVKPSQLETWKFPSTKAKLEIQGDQEAKDLIAAIFANAEKNAHKDVSDTKPPKETSSGGEGKKVAKVATRVPSGAKRAREDDTSGDSRSSKKAATESKPSAVSSAAMSNGKVAAGSTKTATVSKPASTKPAAAAATSGLTIAPVKARPGMLLPGKSRPPVKPLVKPEPAKPEVSKPVVKPEMIPKAPPATTKVEAPKPTVVKPQPTAPAGTDSSKAVKSKVSDAPQPSRFASLLAEIAEPKKVVAPTPPPLAAPDPNETEEQRVRRLRKEERRRLGLKVAFRGDDQLVEIREFTRHPDEIAFTSSGLGDVKSENKNKEEGMALKKGHIGELAPWQEPVAIDFVDIPREKREQTFVTRGGLKTFTTEQQKFTEKREAKELMVIYTDPSDIPPTPKSPHYEPPSMYDDVIEGTVVNLPQGPNTAEIRQREMEQTQQGFWAAVHAAQARLDLRAHADFTKAMTSVSSIAQSYNGYPSAMPPMEAPKAPPVAPAPPAVTPVAPPRPELRIDLDPALAEQRDQQTYQLLISDLVKHFRELDPYDPSRPKTVRRRDYPDPQLQTIVDYLEDLFAFLRQSMSGAAEPVAVQPAIPVASQPASQDYSTAWAQYIAQQAQPGQQPQPQQWYGQQQDAYTQVINSYLQPQAAQAPSPQTGGDLAAILAAFGAAQQAPQGAPAPDAAQIQALMAALGGQPQVGQPVLPGAANEDALRSLMNWAQQGQAGANPSAQAPPFGGGYTYPGQQGPHIHPDRDRELRERERDRDRDRDGRDQERDLDRNPRHNNRGKNKNRDRDRNRDQDGDSNSDIPDHLRGINRSLIGTKQCSFWARGQCAKGDKCTFRHD